MTEYRLASPAKQFCFVVACFRSSVIAKSVIVNSTRSQSNCLWKFLPDSNFTFILPSPKTNLQLNSVLSPILFKLRFKNNFRLHNQTVPFTRQLQIQIDFLLALCSPLSLILAPPFILSGKSSSKHDLFPINHFMVNPLLLQMISRFRRC